MSVVVELMVPAGVINGVEYWVRAEVAADHPGRVYGWLDTHYLHTAADLSADGWTQHADGWRRP